MSITSQPYLLAAIEGETANLAGAVEGSRNQTLFKCAARLASLGFREGEILHHLKPVAESIGLRGRELYRTVKSGVKAGNARPRIPSTIDDRPRNVAARPSLEYPRMEETGVPRPVAFIANPQGPAISSDEIRRHVYKLNGRPVRLKIKKKSGYTSWYRVTRDGRDGWQAAKPETYVACPYVGNVDPFAAETTEQILFWPEGEKDCDSLSAAGLPALTFGGTGDGLPEGSATYVRDRHLVILADNDVGGREHALRKAAAAYPIAKTVKVVEFPELPPKGDVSDYLKSATAGDLIERVTQAPLWSPPRDPVSGWRNSVVTASELKRKTFSPVKYVLPGYIPEGVTIFAGKPKTVKSWLLYDLCLAAAADRFVLGQIKPIQGDVLYLALEDSERRLKKRLQKLWPNGDWPEQLKLTTDWRKADEGGLQDIAEWCDSVPKPVLIVIDTLEKFRPVAKHNSAAYSTDYLAIAGLHKLAHIRGIAVVVIHHVRKMEADDPFDMVSGTNGLTGAADTTLVLRRQSGSVTLYARGRDIEEQETACQFDKLTCRWTLLGDAQLVQSSSQRAAIIEALSSVGEDGLHISEIMAATERSDRNAVDQLLHKMHRDGEIARLRRGHYAIAGKIDKK